MQYLGKYEIIAEIGRGAMGAVYKARDPLIDRLVALKTITGGPSAQSNLLDRFYQEARSAGTLQHPNIVTIYELGHEKNTPFIAMEYLEGESLDRIIEQHPVLPLSVKLGYIVRVCDALAYAHQHNVVHRDVKPANIMVTKEGVVKVVDFGIARLTDMSMTQPNMMIGSRAYMSPQLYKGERADARSDIWAVGVSLYELLAYKRPFTGDSEAELMFHIIYEKPEELLGLSPECTEELVPIVNKMLEKKSEDRYQSMEDLLHAIEPIWKAAQQATVSGLIADCQQLLVVKDLQRAQALLRKALHIDVGNSQAKSMLEKVSVELRRTEILPRLEEHVSRAQGFLKAGQLREAKAEAHAALGLDSKHEPAHKLLAEVEIAVAKAQQLEQKLKLTKQRLAEGALTEAAAALGQALELDEANLQAHELKKQIEEEQVRRERRKELSTALARDAGLLPPAGIPSADVLESRILDSTVWPTLAGATRIEPPPTLISTPDSLGSESQSSGFKPSPPSFQTEPPDRTIIISGPDPLFPRVHLVFTSSADNFLVGRTVTIKEIPFLIGRAAPHLAIASDAALSREHAVIDWDGSSFTLSDLESTNGTYLDGRRVLADRKESLFFGATIRLSRSTVLTFSSDDVSELPDFTGQVIDKRFRLTKLIRASVKAAVYEASDNRLPQPAAVKLLSPSLVSYPGYLEQFNREAQTAATLHHPHICKIVDHGQTPLDLGRGKICQVNYICMEMLDGGSLSDKLAAEGHIDFERVNLWLNPLCDALNYMHLQGVIHSGLKPTSIVFDKNGSPYLTDFAIANTLREGGRPALLGAPDFLSPEQWDGLASTRASDQYALGVLTYLMLTGTRPYEAQHDPDNRRKNFARGHVPAHEQASRSGAGELPRAVSDVLKRALSVKPEDRYSSVWDFFLAFRKSMSNPVSRRAGTPRAFISYRRNLSAGWAVLFARELSEKHKISVFVDTQRIDTAVRLPVKILNAIQDCDIFVCLLGKSTLRSNWVQEEIRLAWQNNKPMVPVFQESFAPPSETAGIQPHVAALMSYEGVYLLDRRNIHIDYSVSELAKIINSSTGTEKDNAPTGDR